MIIIFLFILLFTLLFVAFQTIAMKNSETTFVREAKNRLRIMTKSKGFQAFFIKKQIILRKQGADIFLKDGLTVSQWYLYKLVIGTGTLFLGIFISRVLMKSNIFWLISGLAAVTGWLFLDLFVWLENKSTNEAMMSDIMEMSRSVLYGKRGGQYISDAMRDAVLVIENKRLKMAFIRLRNQLDAGKSIEECLDELELGFSNGEIAAFCTVIKSLQSTGQVDEALKTLETNIQREQAGVNKRRCVMLENKTMLYVMLIAFDILAVILYCIIMKLLEMQIAF